MFIKALQINRMSENDEFAEGKQRMLWRLFRTTFRNFHVQTQPSANSSFSLI